MKKKAAQNLLEQGFKQCAKCKKILPLAAFRKEKRAACGLSARCRDCLSFWGQRCAAKGRPFLSPTASTTPAKVR